jgi:lysozyme
MFMRLPAGLLFCGLLAGLAGCQSQTTSDVLSVGTSQEKTGAIAMPGASIGSGAKPRTVRPPMLPPAAVPGPALAMATPPQTPVPFENAQPELAPSDMPGEATPAVMTPGAPTPSVRPANFVVPGNPAATTARSRMHIYSQRFRDAKPINFGRHSPRAYQVHGVDVSRWQGNIDWRKLREQGANFTFIKATDGGDHTDPMFRTNWNGAKAAGLKRGAYHFFYWCRTAGEQADWFIRNVPRDPEALPPVIDVEWNHDSACRQKLSPKIVREKMKVFMEKVERHYGKRPIIYTAPDFYEDNLEGAFNEYPFWLRAVAEHPSKVYPNRRWVFWQYSGSGLSHGVTGRIDLNTFYGSAEDWHRWVASN